MITTNGAVFNYSYSEKKLKNVTKDLNVKNIKNVCYDKHDKTFLCIANKLDDE